MGPLRRVSRLAGGRAACVVGVGGTWVRRALWRGATWQELTGVTRVERPGACAPEGQQQASPNDFLVFETTCADDGKVADLGFEPMISCTTSYKGGKGAPQVHRPLCAA